jgi:prolyl oligopeptidase
MDALSKRIIEDTIVDVKFSGLSWRGNEGFYYSSYENQKEASFLQKLMTQIIFPQTERRKRRVIFGADQNADT